MRKTTGPDDYGKYAIIAKERKRETTREEERERERERFPFGAAAARENSSLSRGHRDARYSRHRAAARHSASHRLCPHTVLFPAVALSCSSGGSGSGERGSEPAR